ncbi:MAG: PilZ domain-containing protein [Spirochaetaceae bacterium]|nr:MAG: PilZ domain-containing protein [Spirochaetaceae bacterium]
MFSEDRLHLAQPQNVENRDQRRHIRIEHSGTVQLVGEGRRFSGQAINLSRTGMQVVVNLPDSYESVRSITFTLPNSEHTLELPCRIVRYESGNGNEQSNILGLEFSYQGEAQLLLIENYIREMKKKELADTPHHSEMRQIPRADCSIRDISVNKSGLRIVSIDNISTEGLLISFEGDLNPDEPIELTFSLPGDKRRIQISGYITYTIRNEFQLPRSAGLRFVDPKETVQARIRNYIVASTSSSAIKYLCDDFIQCGTEAGYSIKNRERIVGMFQDMLNDGTVLNVLLEGQLAIYESRLELLNTREKEFEAIVFLSTKQDLPVPGLTAYFTYTNGGAHYFKTTIARNQKNRLAFKLPQVVLQSEKRSHQRKVLSTDLGVTVLLHPHPENGSRQICEGRLIDISRNGFLCEVELPVSMRGVFCIGQMVRYEMDERWGLGTQGQIRRLQESALHEQKIVLHLGLEAGIERSVYRFSKVEKIEWDRASENVEKARSSGCECRVVEYTNRDKQGIRALINATRFFVKAPVVIMPPGFGKKKEVLAPLVATLLANFSVQNKDIVTIRYDGINKPGESYNCAKKVSRGYEMLHYTANQGIDDLETTLEYVYSNPWFTPERVILVSFSMSSIDARRYLATRPNHGIDLWISAMGVPSAQSTLQKILGGLDVIGNYKMGNNNGIMGILGHLIDMDSLARGLVENKFAYMTDSRRDMSRISIPTLWIYGTYDKWVDVGEVSDIMSINSYSNREVIEVPAGHNLHTSDDALKVYRIITSRIFRWLHNRSMNTVDPNHDEMIRLISYERERLQNEKGIDAESYWKSYLIGNKISDPGYDFYDNFAEFRQFMDLEARLIDLRPGDRLIDLGCGTGLLLQSILKEAKKQFQHEDHAELVAVDLVPEALEKVKMKCTRLLARYPNLASVHINYSATNLEPNRWLPICEYVCNPELDFNYLRNKIQGLKNSYIDKLIASDWEELLPIMKGEIPLPSTSLNYKYELGQECYHVIVEFNKAARFLRENLGFFSLANQRLSSGGGIVPTGLTSTTTSLPDFDQLRLGNQGLTLFYPFENNSFNKLVASLFLSYLFNPQYAVAEFYRILEPGGTALISSMKPDSDVSVIFTNYIEKLNESGGQPNAFRNSDKRLAATDMLNEAASLFELEQEGFFRFFTAEELIGLCENCGFQSIRIFQSLGNPPQAHVLVAQKPLQGDENTGGRS